MLKLFPGPIVRINPHEVHFNDPEFIDSIFPGPGRKTNKYYFTGRRTGSKGTPQFNVVIIVDLNFACASG